MHKRLSRLCKSFNLQRMQFFMNTPKKETAHSAHTDAARMLGKRGGQAGRGRAKARPRAAMRAAARKRWAIWRAMRATQNGQPPPQQTND
jgi:hypothetical protein